MVQSLFHGVLEDLVITWRVSSAVSHRFLHIRCCFSAVLLRGKIIGVSRRCVISFLLLKLRFAASLVLVLVLLFAAESFSRSTR
jgi:hypothetical protein